MDTNKEEIELAIEAELEEGKKKYGIGFKIALLKIMSLEKMLNPEVKETRLIPLVDWNKHHPDPSVPALRMLVFRAEENGFDKVITRRGKRILIDELKYFEWQKSRGCA